MANTKSFVWYETFFKQTERLIANGMEKEALELIRALEQFGLYGQLPEAEDEVWLYGLEQMVENIQRAKDRYAASVENGKKGGRPPKAPPEEIRARLAQGKTKEEVAQELGISTKTVERAIAEKKTN